MANVLIESNGRLEYLESVNTGEYVVDPNAKKGEVQPKPGVLINPNISAVRNVDRKYWKISGNAVVEMSNAEKKVIDDAEQAKIKEAKDSFNTLTPKEIASVLIKKGILTKEDFE